MVGGGACDCGVGDWDVTQRETEWCVCVMAGIDILCSFASSRTTAHTAFWSAGTPTWHSEGKVELSAGSPETTQHEQNGFRVCPSPPHPISLPLQVHFCPAATAAVQMSCSVSSRWAQRGAFPFSLFSSFTRSATTRPFHHHQIPRWPMVPQSMPSHPHNHSSHQHVAV